MHQAGQLREAATIYRQVLDINPDHADANHLLGVLLYQLGNSAQAVELISRAIATAPDQSMYYSNLGNALQPLGKLDEAVANYHKALAFKPDYAEVHNNLGVVLQEQGRPEEAVAACYKALAIKPDYAEAHSNLGNALQPLGKFDEAVASYHKALAFKPDYAEVHNNLGTALRQQGRLDEAVASHQKAIALRPDYADAHFGLSLVLLLRGDFPNGFEQYQWRRAKICPRRVYAQPEWDGGPFPGRTLLLHAEQGLGDTLHFIRYAPLVRELGGRVVVECQKPLVHLLGTVAGIDALVPESNPLPPFDLHAPLLSLPHLLGTTEVTVPAAVPYLSPEAGSIQVWRQRLGRGEELKVGLVWAGSPGHKNDRNRSIPLERLRRLLDVPRVRFFALQVGERASDIEAVGLQGLIDDISPDLNDFADTAAALTVLDLLISVDTAAAHLAGALGRPVWLLLPFVPDWRWMMDREDSPWYPTMRLFRQPAQGDWLSAIHRAGNELAALVGGDRTKLVPKPPDQSELFDIAE